MKTAADHGKDRVIQRARALFDAKVETLDAATAAALRARRREALSRQATPRRAIWWWPAGGLATAALALALVLPRDARIQGGEPDPTKAVNAAQFADGAMAEFENDAEFYVWLTTLPANADDDSPGLPAQAPQEGWTL